MKKVAIIGTQGVPASYGGFESLVENIIGENQSPDVHYTIYCSAPALREKLPEYKGCKLVYLPLNANGKQSIPYDILSMVRCIFSRYDAVLILGVSGCLFLPIFRLLAFGKRIIVNIDGQEYRRDKWGKWAKRVLRASEIAAIRFAHRVVTDNKAIHDYVLDEYGRSTDMIAYGGDHVMREISPEDEKRILDEFGLQKGEYAVSVCRIEPENNCHVTLEAFARSNRKLAFVGNWHHSEWSQQLWKKYQDAENILLLESIYDLDKLYVLRKNASLYVHGHKAGGTNPSLVEAMFFSIPIAAFDVSFNRCTTEDQAYYFKNAQELRALLQRTDLDGSPMREIAERQYVWREIARSYEKLY